MHAPAILKSLRKLRLARVACAVAAITCCHAVEAAPALIVNPLFSFAAEGYEQDAPLVRASDGNLYGTTPRGGRADIGTIFRLAPDGVRTLLYTFDGNQGAPTGGLMQASDGNLYGVTAGVCCNGQFAGTVFRISLAGEFATISNFAGTSANLPRGGLVEGNDGNLYGVTITGGSAGRGAVFRVTTSGVATVIHSFASNEGQSPQGRLFKGADGHFYGTTFFGGPNDRGTVYRVTAEGVMTILHSFVPGPNETLPNGGNPNDGVVQGSDGSLYGVTLTGGDQNRGIIFKVALDGTFTRLHSFTSSQGANPEAELVLASDGFLYGSTVRGGNNNAGTVFKIAQDGTQFSTIYHFPGGIEGGGPSAALIQGSDGNFYGTAFGGRASRGIVFRLTPTGTKTTLTEFFANEGETANELMQASDGNLYGTTAAGGSNNQGVIFRMTRAGALTVLHSFTGANGATPRAGLVQATDGNLYGTTHVGGANGQGTIFRIAPDGSGFTTLHSFTFSNAARPTARLVQGSDGALYGVTVQGGTEAVGAVFKITLAGVYTRLHSFVGQTDGSRPSGPLFQANDGFFYGTTEGGGAGGNGLGTVFKISAAGAFSVVATFGPGENFDYPNGGFPQGGVTQGADGNFYGITPSSGSQQGGTIFKVTPAGELSTVHTFLRVSGPTEGFYPQARLVRGADDALYGTTQGGGVVTNNNPFGHGTIFRLEMASGSNSSFVRLYNFTDGSDGRTPEEELTLGSDGFLYGTTPTGGDRGAGAIFKITIAPVITSATTATGQVGFAFSYQITARYGADSFAASGLPLGLSVDSATGTISGTPQCAGNYTIELSATNAAGSDTETLSLSVAPPPAPVITGPADGARTDATPTFTGTTQPGSTVRLTVTGGSSPVQVTTTADQAGNFSVDSPSLQEGSYSVSAVVLFCNNAESSAASNTRTFAVDATAPVISGVPGNITREATGPNGAQVSYTNPTATDNVDGAVPVSCAPASGSTFAIGTTSVTCSASDAAGNTSTVSFSVTVQDTTAPTIGNVPANITAEATSPNGAAVSYANPTATDSVSGNVPVNCSPASGATFAVGSTTVTCSASDSAGNTATATFTVTVQDTTPPVITVPADIVVYNEEGKDGATVTFSVSATDSASGAITPSVNPASGSVFPIGTTTVTVTAQDAAGNSATKTFEVTVRKTELANIATRVPVGTGEKVGIGGFIIRGTDPLRVIVRARGPSMRANGQPVPGAMENPTLDLYDSSGNPAPFAANDNWQDSADRDEIAGSGLAPEDPREAAIIAVLPAGAYTGVVSGAAGSTGNALVEVFALPGESNSSLVNISTRGPVLTADDLLIGGVIVRGGTPQRLLFRAIGPDLANRGVAEALSNPRLELRDTNGDLIISNEDWQQSPDAGEIQSSNLAPKDPREAAILRSLGDGDYTAVVRGENGATGVGMVEVYRLD